MGKRAVVLVIALVLAGAAAFAVFQFLNNYRSDAIAGQELIPVYRALQPIEEGTEGSFVLQGEGIIFTESEEQKIDLPEDAIQTRENLTSVLTGAVAVGPISKNGIITANQWVAPTVQLTPLADLLPTGMQAITISPGDIQGVNGFANPGDRVNVIVTLSLEASLTSAQQPSFGIPGDSGSADGNPESESTTAQVEYTRYVLQGLEVLAVGQELVASEGAGVNVTQEGELSSDGQATGEVQGGEDQGGNSTIYTLAVDPNQAERLVYAMQEGSIYLTLVPSDFEEVDTRGVTIENLFEGNLLDDIFGN